MQTILRLCLLLSVFFAGFSQNRDASGEGLLPFVESFTKSEYHGDNQVWSITQAGDHAIYVANNHYFLRYNGVKWERYTLPNRSIIRSVMADGNRVYTGSYNDFGYWSRIKGKMVYTSIAEKANSFAPGDNEEIWKIFALAGKVYFQSFNEVFVLSKDGRVEKVRFPYQISYCYVVGNDVYVATVRHGIYIMEGNAFRKKDKWNAIENDVIHHIERHGGKMYVFTKNNGIFVEQADELVAWKHLLNSDLKNYVILSAKFVGDHFLAIGTGSQGLYIVDLSDGSSRHISRQNSIKNNAILSLASDAENDLWLGLDNGIAHVEINSPIDVFSDNSGVMGSVYALYPMPKGYILVTNNGIFTYRSGVLEPVPNSQGQVWDIYRNGSEFVIGHNDGTFVYDGAHLKKANTVNGGWKFLKSEFDGVYYQANYAGITWYKDVNDLSSYAFLPNFTKPVRNMAQSKPREIWAADNYKSLYRITFDSSFSKTKVENISQQNGLQNDFGVKIFSYKSELLFLIDKSWYTYNAISGKLVKDDVFNKAFAGISDIVPVDDESFIVEKSGLLYVISQKADAFKWDLIPEKYYRGKVIFENTKAYKTGGKIYINLDDGFIRYSPNAVPRLEGKISVEAFYEGRLIDANTAVENRQPVELHVVSPYFGYNREDLYYRLNKSKTYSRIYGGQLMLNNLSGGNQDIAIFSFDGNTYEKLADYSFYVKFPWYISFWMILLYIVVLSIMFFLYWKWNQMRTNQKLELKEEELKHQREIMEIELKRENELQMQEYEKHILELELQTKSSQVAGKSLSIAKQSEMIENIEKILDSETNLARLKSDIKKVIKHNAVNKHEWESFESNLSQVHNEFIKSLSKRFPQLTSKDIRLSIYLRMNLSSKEIAPLMNISFRGVELHRYRLRKKLNLAADENISKFMLSI